MRFIAGPNGTYRNHEQEVWRNGYREPLATEADTQAGWVERYATWPDGRIKCMPGTGIPVKEQVYGDVEIRESDG